MAGFRKATKAASKLRAAFFGPAGAGKTFTSLRVATGLGGPIAVVDTERGSASKYADRFEFDVAELESKTIDAYCAAMREASRAGYAVLILDSLTHAWQELLDEVDRIAKARYRGNTWSAWSEGTPKQRQLVDSILNYPGHVIATMRSKTEWQTESDGGKNKPVRVGLAPEQGKGIEYEFDLLLELSVDHQGSVLKDRTGKFQDRIIRLPGEDFGAELASWLDDGTRATIPAPGHQKPAPSKPYGKFLIDYADAGNKAFRKAVKSDGLEAPDSLEAVPIFQLNRHLANFAVESGWISPLDPKVKDGKIRDLMAPAWAEHQEELRAEAKAYFAAKGREAIGRLKNERDGDPEAEPEEAEADLAHAAAEAGEPDSWEDGRE